MEKWKPKDGEEKELCRIILRGDGQVIVGTINNNYIRYIREYVFLATQDNKSLAFTTAHGKVVIGADLCRKSSILVQPCKSYNEPLPWEKEK